LNRLKFSFTLLLLTVFLSQNVLGSLSDDIISYHKFDSDSSTEVDEVGNYDFTVTGATYISNAVINGGYSFVASGDYMSKTGFPNDNGQDRTFNLWVKMDNKASVEYIWKKEHTYLLTNGGNMNFQYYNYASSGNIISWSMSSLSNDVWYMFTFVFEDGVGSYIYLDGNIVANDTTIDAGAAGLETDDLYIGRHYSGANPFNGDLEEFAIWNRTLSASEISSLYAGGSPTSLQQYPFTAPTTYFDITLNNISVFNVSLASSCSGAAAFYSTTSGTINTNIDDTCSNDANFTIRAENYFDKTYNNYNVSNDLTTDLNRYAKIITNNFYDSSEVKNFSVSFDGSTFEPLTHPTLQDGYIYTSKLGLYNFTFFHDDYMTITIEDNLAINGTVNASLHQAEVNFTVFEKITGNQIYNFTVGDGVVSDTTINGTAYLNLNSGNITFSFTNDIGYYNESETITVLGGVNQVLNSSFYNHKLTVNAKDFFTNATISDMTINLTIGSYNEYYNISGSNIVLNLTNNLSYTLKVDPLEYASNTSNISFTGLGSLHTVYLFKENSLYIRVYDEEQDKLLNWKNVNIEVIGDALAVENSTSNGALIVEPLVQGDYRIRTNAVDYLERLYFATVTDSSTQTIDVYLLNESSSTNMTVTIKDEKADYVEGAYVKLLRYYLSCNCYKTVEVGQTNFLGETGLRVVFNDELYKFIVEYDDIVYLQTTPFKITSDSLTFTIRIDDLDPTVNLRKKQDLIYNLSFNSVSNNFVYTFSDTNNAVLNGCLKVYKTTVRSDTLYNSTCVESTGATIIVNVAAINGTTYKAVSSIEFEEDETITLDILFKTFGGGSEVFGLMGVFATIILVIIFGFIGKWSPSVSIILVVFSVVLSRLMGLIQIGITPLMGLIGIGVIIALINRA